ncbi:MAG: pyruvate, phosphate dikinase [Solirubrobacterales bacterium]
MNVETDAGRLIRFTAPVAPDRNRLGGKGSSLVSMVQLGLPVPPGFILGTDVGQGWLHDDSLSSQIEREVEARLGELEHELGQKLGDPAAPMLVSVRSGAPVSMPGMMDTVLNVGLNDEVVDGLARLTGDAHFAWNSFERLLHSYATIVRGIPLSEVEDALLDGEHRESDRAATARSAVAQLHRLLESRGDPFPADPRRQVHECLEAVFRSWESPRARTYREHRGIDHELGTAAIIQSMVFGNRDESSGSGVAFSRDPATGEPGYYGDVLFDAQGEDVVSGTCDPDPLETLADRLPDVHHQLCEVLEKLERHAGDLIECEFTIERGRLWILQYRAAQRSARAAVRCAVELVEDGIIDERAAVALVSDEQIEAAHAPRFASAAPDDAMVARGYPASPGAGVGGAVFDASRAQHLSDAGEDVVLVRPTTSPSDIHGFIASTAIVTGHGGRTSHAAVVARGMGRPAVCGVGEVAIDPGGRAATIAGTAVAEGDILAVDGDRGIVAWSPPPIAGAQEDQRLSRLLDWRRRT